MKRLVLALVSLASVVSACAVGEPKPSTYVSDTGVTLNANVYSSFGDTSYWWRYGETTAYGRETPHGTVEISADGLNDPHPVSRPIEGLRADTTYHYQLCVQDQQESPGRIVCTNTDQTFTTAPAGGRSGIAFVSGRALGGTNQDIFVMDDDGDGETNLTNTPVIDEDEPDWSPDGKRLVYMRQDDLWTMNADGTAQVPLTITPTLQEHAPAWSPDGTRIAFDAGGQVHVMPASGGAAVALATSAFPDRDPSWSPDGEKITFIRNSSSIRTVRADGSDLGFVNGAAVPHHDPDWSPDRKSILTWLENTLPETGEVHPLIRTFLGEGDSNGGSEVLTTVGTDDGTPSWSPAGDSVAFEGFDTGGNPEILYTELGTPMRAPLTDDPAFDGAPAWSPRPDPLPDLYVAMGDSATQIGDDRRYPERFFSFLDGSGNADVLHNIGQNGQTSGGMNGSQLTQANQYINDPDTDAAVVTIDIGGNDILQGPDACAPYGSGSLEDCQPTLDTFSSNFETTLDSLDDSLGDDPGPEQVIVMAYYNPWSGRSGYAGTADRIELRLLGSDHTLDCDGTGTELGLNDRIACIGAEHGAKLANAYPPFIGHGTIGDYMYDEVHPNGTGHQVIADTFQDAFETAGP